MSEPTIDELIERHEQLLKLDDALTDHEKTEHLQMDVIGKEAPCGTKHCLAGFAGMQPWFRERGFITVPTAPLSPWMKGKIVKIIDNDDTEFDWDEFFGDEAYDELFHHDFPNDWQQAMTRVRDRLDRLKAEKESGIRS